MDRRPAVPKDKAKNPEKQGYVPPRKPWKPRRFRRAAAAILTSLALLCPNSAKSALIREQEPPVLQLSRGIEGEYEFPGGKAIIEFLHPNLETFDATYRITFDVEGRRYSPIMRFNAPLPGSLGSPVAGFISETRTVILTYNYLIVTQGYKDLLENPGTLQMGSGERLEENSFHVRLPEGARGGNLYRPQAVDGPNGELSTLFALGNGCLWSFRTDVPDGSPVKKEVELTSRASLHAFGEYVLLFQPNSEENFVSVHKRDADGQVVQVANFGASGAVAATDVPSANPIPSGYSFSCGGRSATVTFDEGTSTFTVAATAP